MLVLSLHAHAHAENGPAAKRQHHAYSGAFSTNLTAWLCSAARRLRKSLRPYGKMCHQWLGKREEKRLTPREVEDLYERKRRHDKTEELSLREIREIEIKLDLDLHAASGYARDLKRPDGSVDIEALSDSDKLVYAEAVAKLAVHDVNKWCAENKGDEETNPHLPRKREALESYETELEKNRRQCKNCKREFGDNCREFSAKIAKNCLGCLALGFLVLERSATGIAFWGAVLILAMVVVSHRRSVELYWGQCKTNAFVSNILDPFGLENWLIKTIGLPTLATIAVVSLCPVGVFVLVLQQSDSAQNLAGWSACGFAALKAAEHVSGTSVQSLAAPLGCMVVCYLLLVPTNDLRSEVVGWLLAGLAISTLLMHSAGHFTRANLTLKDLLTTPKESLTLEEAKKLECFRSNVTSGPVLAEARKLEGIGPGATPKAVCDKIDQKLDLDLRAAKKSLAKLKGKDGRVDPEALCDSDKLECTAAMAKLAMYEVRKVRVEMNQSIQHDDPIAQRLHETKLATERAALAEYLHAHLALEQRAKSQVHLNVGKACLGCLVVGYIVLIPTQTYVTEHMVWAIILMLTLFLIAHHEGQVIDGKAKTTATEIASDTTKQHQPKEKGNVSDKEKVRETNDKIGHEHSSTIKKPEPIAVDSTADYLGMYHLSLLSQTEFEMMKSRVAELHGGNSAIATVSPEVGQGKTSDQTTSTKSVAPKKMGVNLVNTSGTAIDALRKAKQEEKDKKQAATDKVRSPLLSVPRQYMAQYQRSIRLCRD